MVEKTDVLVIGAGPGGYPAAIRAAQLGKSVTIVERERIGGECLNYGCIPSKSLISAADFYSKMVNDASKMGIEIEEAKVDMKQLQQWKGKIKKRLVYGVKQLLKSHDVNILMGTAHFLDDHQVKIDQEDGEKTIKAKHIIIATGADFLSLEGFNIDEKEILSAKGALGLDRIPKELVVIGAGYIGLELGTAFAKLGSHVTFVEIMPEIMPKMESSLVKEVKRTLEGLEVDIYTESEAKRVTRQGENMELKVDTKDGTEKISADKILISIGKKATTADLHLEEINIDTDDRGFINVNDQMQTNISHIYAVGDCTGGPFLAHRAMKQGIVAAEAIAGKPSAFDYRAIPAAAFTDPEIATVGMSKEEAEEAGHEVITAQAPFRASGRAMAMLETEGYVKVVIDAESNVLLGVQIVGPHASDLISEAALAIEMGATAEDVGWTMHPHPTLPEMIMEAAESALGKAIHVANVRRNRE